jgi:tripartite-type tricarboxylate transporter receptor subunit TctC
MRATLAIEQAKRCGGRQRACSNDTTSCDLSRRVVLAGAFATVIGRQARAADVDPLVRLVVPFPAGGSLDALGRVLAPLLGRLLKANVVVFNVAGGATGQRAAGQVAHAPPDGRTLLLGTSASHAIAVSLFPRLPYRPEEDFVAVGRVCTTRLVLVAHPSFQIRSLAELIVAARASPTPIAYGSWGIGSGGHLAVEAVRLQAGIRLTHVPYESVAQTMQGLLGRQIPLAVSDIAGAIALVRDGKVVPLVVSGTKRVTELPQVATLADAQLPFTTESWCALFVPAHTPDAEQVRLEEALLTALEQPPLKQVLSTLVLEPGAMGREAFQRLWHDDIAAWRRVVVAGGISLN